MKEGEACDRRASEFFYGLVGRTEKPRQRFLRRNSSAAAFPLRPYGDATPVAHGNAPMSPSLDDQKDATRSKLQCRFVAVAVETSRSALQPETEFADMHPSGNGTYCEWAERGTGKSIEVHATHEATMKDLRT